MARIFLGIPIPEAQCLQLVDFVSKIPPQPGIRWIRPANYHLTLAFLDELPEEAMDNVREAFCVGLKNHRAFSLDFYAYTFAPSGRDPRMLWARWEKNEPFRKLYERIRILSEQIQPNLLFRNSPIPHITLARLKGGVDTREIDLRKGGGVSPLKVEKVVIWESLRNEKGQVSYKALSEIILAREDH
ncbi:MAG: RNA 2',3'-cyclic phosphodiesterase [Bacteroidota bacterium]